MFKARKNYFVRTITNFYTGATVRVGKDHVVLGKAAWIADTGRFADAMKTGTFDEVEPYPDGMAVTIPFSAIVDLCEWPHALPREQK